MFSDKTSVNILTSLLIEHKIRKAVVCPGSRNAPVVHNLCASGGIECHSITDERSAGFFALGLSQATGEPVVVCVTSGSAVLNVLPAVAEAYYQHVPLIVVSADRPQAMTGQLQGQTLPQPGCLEPFAVKSVSLPEGDGSLSVWHCNRMVNEALTACRRCGGQPVHINVPLTEPLFNFSVDALPEERVVTLHAAAADRTALNRAALRFMRSRRPLLAVGQLSEGEARAVAGSIKLLESRVTVVREQLSACDAEPCRFDELLAAAGDDNRWQPDSVIYLGDTFVSKRIKRFLQGCRPEQCVIVNRRGELTDVTMNATDVIAAGAADMIYALLRCLDDECDEAADYHDMWAAALQTCSEACRRFTPPFSQMLAVRRLCEEVSGREYVMHCGNSSAVRLGQIYNNGYIHVNRGVNGIEGSLSAAVGYASASRLKNYCVIGDLSFFYDQNALWNEHLPKNLWILLLNNGGGGIFHQLQGLSATPYRNEYVAASHHFTAEGACSAAGVDYSTADDVSSLDMCVQWLAGFGSGRPLLLEVKTDADADAAALRSYYEFVKKALRNAGVVQ